MDRLGAMRVFVQIVDRGSMTAAATALGKSQPTIVRSLAELERELGVTLLRRSTRRMSLTEEGELYLEHARDVLQRVDDIDSRLGSGAAQPRGRLRVAAPVHFGRIHLAPLALAFMRRYPEIELDLVCADRNVDLVEEGFDVALRIGELADSSMRAVELGQLRRSIYASPQLLRRVGNPLEPKQLRELPCVCFTGIERAQRWSFAVEQQTIAVEVSGRLRVNQVAMALDATVAGSGFGRFLSYQAADALREGKLVRVLEAFENPTLPVRLLLPEHRRVAPRLRSFVDYMRPRIRKVLRELP